MGLGKDYEFVRVVFCKRVRVYAGHSAYRLSRIWKWHSGTTTGLSLRLAGDRVVGIQWRPADGA